MSSDLSRAFGRSPFLAHWITKALRRRVTQNFASLRYAGEPPALKPGQGIILYSNHPSWWDPAVFAVLQDRFFADRPGFGPIDAQALARYPLLRRAGFLSLDQNSVSSIRRFLRDASDILRQGGVFWITAQGAFTDARMRPLQLRPGLAHLAARMPGTPIVPLALDYSFGTESRPDVAVMFGSPLTCSGERAATMTPRLEAALEVLCDRLAEKVSLQDHASFTPFLGGREGMGGVYASLQRITASLSGRKFEKRHVAR
ncbi:lysophospholipid acyltransferase family protein [Asaia sp. VD9]|uniref:lysophospholipid acyltransferase family protein n=1 Tax=Asaia sp. VD9 TaxID=3081235 RepID=UPI003019BFEA